MADLYNRLRDLRKKLADQEGVEVFRVFQNVTIDEICLKKPQNLEELLEIKGMGEKKVAKYGKAILEIVKGELEGGASSAQVASLDVKGLELTSNFNTQAQVFSQAKQKVTVSEYLEYLNLVLAKTADVKVVGEVSGGKMYPSGFYFTLKDKQNESALSCYLPTYTYRGLGIPLLDGMEVSVEGSPRVVKRNGRFQFTVENLELVGEGALKKAYDALKAKFEAEGLFARKRELPEFTKSIGVVTSRAGAVIHDFKNNLAKLGFKIYLKDVRVEGAQAVTQIISAIKFFNTQKIAPDVLVIMRGGGSLEDLQAFNSEEVVRAVFASKIPTIVAIGHDKDVPLAELSADIMVSTPTAASHAVNATWNRLQEELPRMQSGLVYGYIEVIAETKAKYVLATSSLNNWCKRLSQSYKRLQEILQSQLSRYIEWIQEQQQEILGQMSRIGQMQEVGYKHVLVRVASATGFLSQVNPERQLRLGYAIVKSGGGALVRKLADVAGGDELNIQVSDGIIHSKVK